jgi:beta-1,4-mannosyl-glycoprotein beta-1,4-N-acetylglucosaminyltransferase
MIVDCFTFFNELDLLEVRLHTLAPYVDAFILSEANRTFQGAEKPLYFHEHRHDVRFACGRPILAVSVDLSAMDGIEYEGQRVSPWCREEIQRRLIAQAFDSTVGPPVMSSRWDLIHDLRPSDRIILSDLDEIPQLDFFRHFAHTNPGTLAWKQTLYYYWVNMRCWDWVGPVSCTFESFNNQFGGDMQQLRNSRGEAQYEVYGGWHFSFLGGREAIKEKMEAFSHTEYRHCADPANIRYALTRGWKHNSDVFGRKMHFELMPDDSHLPRYLAEHKERFKDWWFHED